MSMTTSCSPLANHPRSNRDNNSLQYVSSRLMMRLRSVMQASFNVHSIFCWHSSRSVRIDALGHSFLGSPLGLLKEYPRHRMNVWDWRMEKRRMVIPSEHSGVLPTLLRHSTLCCRRGTRYLPGPGQLPVPTLHGRPRAAPEVFCEIHLREVSMCACSKKGGKWPFSAKRKHCIMVASCIASCTLVRHQQLLLPRSRCSSPQEHVRRLRASRWLPAGQRALRLWPS